VSCIVIQNTIYINRRVIHWRFLLSSLSLFIHLMVITKLNKPNCNLSFLSTLTEIFNLQLQSLSDILFALCFYYLYFY
jgi:hypothetical protein